MADVIRDPDDLRRVVRKRRVTSERHWRLTSGLLYAASAALSALGFLAVLLSGESGWRHVGLAVCAAVSAFSAWQAWRAPRVEEDEWRD